MHNFVVAYPEELDLTWNAGFCCESGTSTGVDDVDFLSRLIDELVVDYGVDPERVFATGVSAGAMMAYRLGCELPARIAGVGSVAGAMVLDQCLPGPGRASHRDPRDSGSPRALRGRPRAPEGVVTQPAPATREVVER